MPKKGNTPSISNSNFVADSICPKGSRLAHLYGLRKTHKPRLAMRPILSATGTYNFKLAKWLDEKLKSLSINKYTVSNPLKFAEKLCEKQMAEGDILVSYHSSINSTIILVSTLRRFSPMYQLMKRSKYLPTKRLKKNGSTGNTN